MDGANAWQKFRTVTITYLRPAMLPYAIYGFVITFNLFFLPYFMTARRALRAHGDPRHARRTASPSTASCWASRRRSPSTCSSCSCS